jgi:hypothetical protein
MDVIGFHLDALYGSENFSKKKYLYLCERASAIYNAYSQRLVSEAKNNI